jgi:hypothetical protein
MKYIEWGLDRESPRTYIVLGALDRIDEIISTLRELVKKEGDNESGLSI